MCSNLVPNSWTPGFDRAAQNLTRRYNNGMGDGSLVGVEAGLVGNAVNDFREDLSAARADGMVTPWERANLSAERQAVSGMIYGLRHNGLGNLTRPAVDPFHPNLGTTGNLTRPAVDPFHPNLGTTGNLTRPAVDPFHPDLGTGHIQPHPPEAPHRAPANRSHRPESHKTDSHKPDSHGPAGRK